MESAACNRQLTTAPSTGRRQEERTLVAHCLFVVHVLPESRSHALQVSNVIGDLLDGPHLFLQEFALDVITHLKYKVVSN